MPIRMISADVTAWGTAVSTLADDGIVEDIGVAAGVRVISTGGIGVHMLGEDETVFVDGVVKGAVRGVSLGSADLPTVNQGLLLSEGAFVSATGPEGAAVEIAASRSMLINRGTIVSQDTALLYSAGIRHDATNHGTIEAGGVAILRDSLTDYGRLTFVNRGTVTAGDEHAYVSLHIRADDNVVNRGHIQGSIALGGSTDTYDGWGGTITGRIEGGSGTDSFILGASAETILGGSGIDTLDLRHGTGVTLSLANAVAGKGIAAGDRFRSIEVVYGSSGADRILGSGADNELYGNAGDDVLDGRAWNDSLFGSAGNDTFRLTSRLGSDFVSDFRNEDGDDDLFMIKCSAFDLSAQSGPMQRGMLVRGLDPVAKDGNDLVLFDTDDRTLWIDRDGSGGAAAVLVATLGTSTTLTAEDFVFG